MSEEDYLKTVSSSIDENSRDQKIRHTLQPKTNKVIQINENSSIRPRSKSYVQPTKIILEPPILEEEDEEQIKTGDGNSKKISFAKKTPSTSRSNSMTGVRSKIVEIKGYDNSAFNGVVTNQDFQRGYLDSSRSSAHGSVNSLQLQVQREQYCCFSRWSPFEKRLATSVAVLAAVIIGLVVTVGFLARRDGIDHTFMWKP